MPRPAMLVAIVTAPLRPACQLVGEGLRSFDARGADQHGAACLMEVDELVERRVRLALDVLVHGVGQVDALARQHRRHIQHVETVDVDISSASVSAVPDMDESFLKRVKRDW